MTFPRQNKKCLTQSLRRQAHPSSQQWERVRPRLTDMYKNQRKTLREIRTILTESEPGFRASVKQFRDRFKKWGLNTKNIRRHVKDRALAKINAGEVDVSDAIVLDDGTVIPVHKIQRHQAEKRRMIQADAEPSRRMLSLTEQKVGAGAEPKAQSPAESSSSHTLTPDREGTPRMAAETNAQVGDSNVPPQRQPSSESLSPARPMGPEENPGAPRTVVKNIWALRTFIGLSSWFFDFLCICRDPALSPLHPESWGDALESQLTAFVFLFTAGRSKAAKEARRAFDELVALLNVPDGIAAIGTIGRQEDVKIPEFRTLHRICDAEYPEEVKLGFSHEEVKQELMQFRIEMTKMRDDLQRFRADLQEEPRRRLELDARPFRRGEGSPATFYHRLREVVKFVFPIDIFEDDGLNFGQIRAFNPGPHPGPMICFYGLGIVPVVGRVVGDDPAMYDESDLEEYGVSKRQPLLKCSVGFVRYQS